MIMKKPEADVIRFSGSDVVAASNNLPNTVSFDGKMGDGVKKNGGVTYNGVQYTVNSTAVVNDIMNAMSGLGVNTSTKIGGSGKYTFNGILNSEVNGGETGNGLTSDYWQNSTFVYDAEKNWFTKKE